MKKKILGGIAIVAIAVAVAFNVSLSKQKQDATSTLALSSVEALAQLESGDYCDLYLVVGKSSRCYKMHTSYLSPIWTCERTGDPKDYCSPLYTNNGSN